MNEPQVPQTPERPSFIPLLQWLENQRVLQPGTVAQVNVLADHVKGLGNVLKQAGLLK